MLPPRTAWGWRAAVFAVVMLFLIAFGYTVAVLAGVL